MPHCNRQTPSTRAAFLKLAARGLHCLIAWIGLLAWITNGAAAQEDVATRGNNADLSQRAVDQEAVQDAAVSLTQSGTVIFRDTPLAEVILILSEQWDVNIIAGSDVGGQVNGTFRNESLKSILDSVLTANGLHYRQIGNSLVVLPINDSGGSRPSFHVEVLQVPAANVDELDELIEALKLQMSQEGQIVPIRASGKLTVQDTPERIAAVKALLSQIAPMSDDQSSYISTNRTGNLPTATQPTMEGSATRPANLAQPLGALELRPQFILAAELQSPLEMIAGAENFSILEQENTIVIFGDAAIQEKARLLMQQLDKPRPQVRITGYIYDVDLSEIEKLGVDWNQRMMTSAVDANGVPRNLAYGSSGLLVPTAASNPAATLSGVVEETASAVGSTAAAATAPTGGQFLFRTLSSHAELQAFIQALDQTKGSRLLADPHVTVVDRHQASLGIVTEIPIQQLTQTQQGGAIGTTTFREAGISLDVTPHIASDGTIEMEVSPTFSVLAGFQGGNPIIDTRRATTVVRVNHGQALVIGGLRSKTTVETVKGIPGLMSIKYLGALFRVHDADVRESELLVFIMPEIVGYCGGLPREMQALHVGQQQLSRLQTAADSPFLCDCHDHHCPIHHERPRIHNGMHDAGLIGGHDMLFIHPTPAMPNQSWPASPAENAGAQPDASPSDRVEILPLSSNLDPAQLPLSSSSRRVPVSPVGFRPARQD